MASSFDPRRGLTVPVQPGPFWVYAADDWHYDADLHSAAGEQAEAKTRAWRATVPEALRFGEGEK